MAKLTEWLSVAGTPIGVRLKESPRLLWFTALFSLILVGADLFAVARGKYIELFRPTLAVMACLFCAFVSSSPPMTGAVFGFCFTPVQSLFFWAKASLVVGLALSVVLLIAGVGFIALGGILPPPRIRSASEIIPLFVFMCITTPLLEEVIYRLILCPPLAALMGANGCIFVSGLVFAGLHFIYGNPSPENMLGGFVLTWAFLKSGTLIVPIALHSLGNFCAFLANIVYFFSWEPS
jgi:membrane protease YdiL (CAAX protease family)